MKRLILMRHAKTEPWYQGGDDETRALLPRGKADAALVSTQLVARDWVPDKVLVSSARRTRETWTAIKPDFTTAQHRVLDGLYLAGTSALEEAILAHQNVHTLMLIGHNPGMHDLACAISSRAGSVHQKAAMQLAVKMPTAAAALFEADEDGPFHIETFRLQDYIIAKKLRPEEEHR